VTLLRDNDIEWLAISYDGVVKFTSGGGTGVDCKTLQ
jgi:hypothetical protein